MFLYRLRTYLFAGTVGAVLIVLGTLSLRSSLISFDRSNVCAADRGTKCFVREAAVVQEGNGSTEMRVRPADGDVESVASYDG